MLSFVSVIFILGTIFMACIDKFTQMAFVEYRNFPGGPAAYEQAMFWIPVDELGNVAFVIGNWLMDALLVWRCTVIYGASGGSGPSLWAIMLFPSLLLVASVVLGILFLAQTSTSSPFSAVNFTLAYFIMTLALNIIVTILIVIRLLVYRRRIVETLGREHVVHYTNVAAILVESASLYSAFSILFLVPFALNNSLSQVFLQTMSQVQTVSSLLIIFRVATGKGWSETTDTQISTTAGSSAIRLKNMSTMRFVSGGTESTNSGPFKSGVTVSQEVLRDKEESFI